MREGSGAPEEATDVVRARRLGLTVRQGRVFAGVNISLPPATALIVRGPARSGKTALLLAIAGRIRVDEGDLSVLGHDLRGGRGGHAVRRRVGLAEIEGVNGLEGELPVGHHLAERLALHSPWWRPWVRRARVQDVLDRLNAAVTEAQSVDGAAQEFEPVEPGTPVALLHPVQRMLLGAALGLAGDPDVLVVDDVDAHRHERDRRLAWRALENLVASTGRPVTVIAACQDDAEARGALWTHSAQRLALSKPPASRRSDPARPEGERTGGRGGDREAAAARTAGFPFPLSVPSPSPAPDGREEAGAGAPAGSRNDRPGFRRLRA